MLDWPEQTQTSPKRMSWKVRVLAPSSEMTRSTGLSEALFAPRRMRNLPSGEAVAVAVWSAILAVTVLPGEAVPLRKMAWSRWRTMWSEKRWGKLTSARAPMGAVRKRSKAKATDFGLGMVGFL